MPQNTQTPCPCDSGLPYSSCCQPLHAGTAAPDAEALMRSRYSAYALELEPYLLASWHPSTRPARMELRTEPRTQWLGLKVLGHWPDGERAEVEFVARYRIGGRATRLHERSRFVREGGRWYYVDGDAPGRAG